MAKIENRCRNLTLALTAIIVAACASVPPAAIPPAAPVVWAGVRAQRVRPARTLFTHICHELPQSAETELPPHTGLAYDGLKIDLPG